MGVKPIIRPIPEAGVQGRVKLGLGYVEQVGNRAEALKICKKYPKIHLFTARLIGENMFNFMYED